MREIDISADELVATVLNLSRDEEVCILDSCGVGHLGSHLLIAGIRPGEFGESSAPNRESLFWDFDEGHYADEAAIFTLSYELGSFLQGVASNASNPTEPFLFHAIFDSLIIHDYDTGRTYLAGNEESDATIQRLLAEYGDSEAIEENELRREISSNFTKDEYRSAVESIREHIRAGDTYQTNLTQQLRCSGVAESDAPSIFARLRRDHPAPFAAFIKRRNSTVVSASPERFFRIDREGMIEMSPIKGTRRRGESDEEDARLRSEFESSEKDRAENTMIVDLARNDLGRVCEFGSVRVEKLCEIEEHPTLFHLVSTVKGKLRDGLKLSEILQATFPCGSITGAPKIRTMQIIDEIERTPRGLSMGAIGIHLPRSWNFGELKIHTVFDLSVAIRTIVIRDDEAVFNVGGGIVIDSRPEDEYEESLLKAKALIAAITNRSG